MIRGLQGFLVLLALMAIGVAADGERGALIALGAFILSIWHVHDSRS